VKKILLLLLLPLANINVSTYKYKSLLASGDQSRSALYSRITACLQAYAEGETDRQTDRRRVDERDRGCQIRRAGACDMLVQRERAVSDCTSWSLNVAQLLHYSTSRSNVVMAVNLFRHNSNIR